MIIRTTADRLWLTRQVDHARASGELAAHWGNDLFPAPEHRASVVTACRRHDDAWQHLDAEPILDPETKEPYSFLSMPLDRLLPAYLDGAESVGEVDPHAGFLVMMHYEGFFNGRFGLDPNLPSRESGPEADRVKAYLAEAQMTRGRLRAKGISSQGYSVGPALSPATAHAYLLLQVVDMISLFLCLNPDQDWPLGQVVRTAGGERFPIRMGNAGAGRHFIDPWPFDSEAVSFTVPMRSIPKGPYDAGRLAREWSNAEPENISFELARSS